MIYVTQELCLQQSRLWESLFASFIYLIDQTKVDNIMQHGWKFFLPGYQGRLGLCLIALESIWVGNGDLMHHGCTLSAWVQQAEFTSFEPLDQEHS